MLANAIKFSFKNSCIVIKVAISDGHLSISVKDQGQGIESTKNLFQTFVLDHETLNNSRSGIGIGLSTTKALIELIDGSLSVKSDGKNKGTVVQLLVPLYEQS